MVLISVHKYALGKHAGETWKNKTKEEWLKIINVPLEQVTPELLHSVKDFLRKLKNGEASAYVSEKKRQALQKKIDERKT